LNINKKRGGEGRERRRKGKYITQLNYRPPLPPSIPLSPSIYLVFVQITRVAALVRRVRFPQYHPFSSFFYNFQKHLPNKCKKKRKEKKRKEKKRKEKKRKKKKE
jgi:hypothetical protein